MIFRSIEKKADLETSWHRPDRPFFASGACHILAAAFLEAYPSAGFRAWLILPAGGFRGTHVFVSDGETSFDYHGFHHRSRYLAHYRQKMMRLFPGWRAEVVLLDFSPASEAFCAKYRHRLGSQFSHDPFPRARAYLKRFTPPFFELSGNGHLDQTRVQLLSEENVPTRGQSWSAILDLSPLNPGK